MATLHRCDQCKRDQPGNLPYKLERNEFYATLEDGPEDPEFCTLACVVGWGIEKLTKKGWNIATNGPFVTVTEPSGKERIVAPSSSTSSL